MMSRHDETAIAMAAAFFPGPLCLPAYPAYVAYAENGGRHAIATQEENGLLQSVSNNHGVSDDHKFPFILFSRNYPCLSKSPRAIRADNRTNNFSLTYLSPCLPRPVT